ncbi:P1 family peptidase [Pararhizobium mangrovi]|uniref:P1 family peptidase n=1 Tax=Pararhizobium mangrovi TaxID=2590452 RepID=A0A506UE78_9HYPH|nr:P1 family peptidase [Pararhizobium mangrovi]TPW31264.1 P1 family peptidase [Pararhizobium mangrovi]
MKPGPRNLITDVEGLIVGNAADARLKSGVTVLTSADRFTAAVHVMGGAPGTRETDLLAPGRMVETVDALVLSGGSAFGLDAASGVSDGLRAAGRGLTVGPVSVPIVPAAILFDLTNGGDKAWTENPYHALGRAAFEAAGETFPVGSEGAGTGATTGTLKGGLGSASLVLDSGHTVGALVAANPYGSVTVGNGPHFWAAPFEVDGEFGGLGPSPETPGLVQPANRKGEAFASGANTTIAIVATDAALTKAGAQRMATAAHDGMARAIVPSHTFFDGDLVFAAATGAKPPGDDPHTLLMLGHGAALCLARAIARAVYAARPAAGDTLPTWSETVRDDPADRSKGA